MKRWKSRPNVQSYYSYNTDFQGNIAINVILTWPGGNWRNSNGPKRFLVYWLWSTGVCKVEEHFCEPGVNKLKKKIAFIQRFNVRRKNLVNIIHRVESRKNGFRFGRKEIPRVPPDIRFDWWNTPRTQAQTVRRLLFVRVHYTSLGIDFRQSKRSADSDVN